MESLHSGFRPKFFYEISKWIDLLAIWKSPIDTSGFPGKKYFGLNRSPLLFIFFSLVPIQMLFSDQSDLPTEYHLKAVFLFHFAKFVEWPPESFAHDSSDFVISILGNDPFGSFLDEIVSGESINHHPFTVKRIKNIEDLGVSHIVFISNSEMANLNSILPKVQNKPVLTVGDMPEFASNGGMVHFRMVDNKVKIRINLESTASEKLRINSRLLKLSEIVGSDEGTN